MNGERVAYRPEEAAAALGIGRTKVFELIASNELRSVLIGRRRVIPAAELVRFLESRMQDAAR